MKTEKPVGQSVGVSPCTGEEAPSGPTSAVTAPTALAGYQLGNDHVTLPLAVAACLAGVHTRRKALGREETLREKAVLPCAGLVH